MSDVRLPDFPRHWLAVAGDDPSRPLPHDHRVCEEIEGAIACLYTGGYRFTTDRPAPITIADGTKGTGRMR